MKKVILLLILCLNINSFYAAEPIITDPGSFRINAISIKTPPYASKSLNTERFSLEYGIVGSKFDYRNSDGERLDNLFGSTNSHTALVGKIPIKKSNTYFLSSLSYNTYAAKGGDNAVGNYYDWKANYGGANIGIGYEFSDFDFYWYRLNANKNHKVSVFTQVAFAAEFLVHGTQTINNQVYDLRGIEQFDKPFLFARAGAGIVYYASEILSVYVQYMGGMGFSVFKSQPIDTENLNFITHTFSFGVQISLPPF